MFVAGMTGGREEKKVEKFRVFCFGLGGEVEDEEDECDFFTLFFFFQTFYIFLYLSVRFSKFKLIALSLTTTLFSLIRVLFIFF